MNKSQWCIRFCVALTTVAVFFLMVPAFVGAADKIILKHAHQNLSPTDTHTQTAKKFADLVNERSSGRIEIKLYPGTLADGPELLSVAQQGVADTMSVVTNFISARVRALAPIEWVGAYPAEDKFLEVAEGIRPVMTKIFDKEGLTYLSSQYSFADFFWVNRNKNLVAVSDFKGEKLRVPGLWINKQTTALGATPVMILPPELYPSLQRGVIDGLGTIASLVVGFKLYEPAPFVARMPDASASLVIFCANTEKFSRLSAEDQALIRKAAIDAETWSYDYGRKLEDDMRTFLRANTKYVDMSPEQRKAVLDARGSLKEDLLEYSGPLGRELMTVFDGLR
ncbi:MAG: TRAP transporter substrate-binding protein [Deferrisomatales bacterium]|nr:TRAP transporter substrate-binding protein [Deferrisomatales bacterium]